MALKILLAVIFAGLLYKVLQEGYASSFWFLYALGFITTVYTVNRIDKLENKIKELEEK